MNQEEILLKETKGRSLGQSPFTMITKITKTAIFKMILPPPPQKKKKYFPNFTHFNKKQLISTDTTI